MGDVATAILDAAERRIRIGGFNGFSFREVAADVRLKSSSVHYHFPTREKLAAAVVHRYAGEVAQIIDRGLAADPNPVNVWMRAFRETLHSKSACVLALCSAPDPWTCRRKSRRK
jgi:TetR/AcrR family transcriptional repressor of nem operon